MQLAGAQQIFVENVKDGMMEPHWNLEASWSVGTPKLVITCPKDHLPLVPNLLAAPPPLPAVLSDWCCSSKGFGMFSASGFVRQQKEQPVSTLQSFSHLSRSLFGVCLPGCTPAPVCLVNHMARRVVSSLTWGGHTPVFFSQVRKCIYSRSQISPSDICLEPLPQVTGGNCTFGAGMGLCGW